MIAKWHKSQIQVKLAIHYVICVQLCTKSAQWLALTTTANSPSDILLLKNLKSKEIENIVGQKMAASNQMLPLLGYFDSWCIVWMEESLFFVIQPFISVWLALICSLARSYPLFSNMAFHNQVAYTYGNIMWDAEIFLLLANIHEHLNLLQISY